MVSKIGPSDDSSIMRTNVTKSNSNRVAPKHHQAKEVAQTDHNIDEIAGPKLTHGVTAESLKKFTSKTNAPPISQHIDHSIHTLGLPRPPSESLPNMKPSISNVATPLARPKPPSRPPKGNFGKLPSASLPSSESNAKQSLGVTAKTTSSSTQTTEEPMVYILPDKKRSSWLAGFPSLFRSFKRVKKYDLNAALEARRKDEESLPAERRKSYDFQLRTIPSSSSEASTPAQQKTQAPRSSDISPTQKSLPRPRQLPRPLPPRPEKKV